MGWHGAGGGDVATIGSCYFFGGVLQVIGSILEWISGNTFNYIVFGSYGTFHLCICLCASNQIGRCILAGLCIFGDDIDSILRSPRSVYGKCYDRHRSNCD